jgi:hypothetical protein
MVLVPVDVAVARSLVAKLLYYAETPTLDGGSLTAAGPEVWPSERALSRYFTEAW